MAEVVGVERVVSALGSWSPSDLAFIEGLELHMEQSESNLQILALFQPRVEGRGWPSIEDTFHSVRLNFGGVRDLKLEGFGGGLVQIMGFEIASIRDRGWEDVELEVTDYEDGKLSFRCVSAEVLSVGTTRRLSS